MRIQALISEFSGRRIDAFAIDIDHRDTRARFEKPLGNRFAVASRRAGDDRDFSPQREQLLEVAHWTIVRLSRISSETNPPSKEMTKHTYSATSFGSRNVS